MSIDSRISSLALHLWNSILVRPFTTFYVSAFSVIILTSAGKIELGVAMLTLTGMFLILLLLGLHRENQLDTKAVKVELTTIHTLVNSQHTELVDRVEQLIRALNNANVAVPAAPKQNGAS